MPCELYHIIGCQIGGTLPNNTFLEFFKKILNSEVYHVGMIYWNIPFFVKAMFHNFLLIL
jgi:hypothetical protein